VKNYFISNKNLFLGNDLIYQENCQKAISILIDTNIS